jgi:hypothetical protein
MLHHILVEVHLFRTIRICSSWGRNRTWHLSLLPTRMPRPRHLQAIAIVTIPNYATVRTCRVEHIDLSTDRRYQVLELRSKVVLVHPTFDVQDDSLPTEE